jgi:hypothetical protein
VANIPANELETRCRDRLSWNWYVVKGTGLERSDVLMKSYLLQFDKVTVPVRMPEEIGRTIRLATPKINKINTILNIHKGDVHLR